MVTFADSLKTEAAGRSLAERFFASKFTNYKRDDSIEFQKNVGDYRVTLDRREFAVEVKTENRWTGNLFLEEWSNYSRLTPGWLRKPIKADYLLYIFLDEKVAIFSNMTSILMWMYKHHFAYHNLRLVRARCDQKNDTWGWLVSVHALTMNTASKVYNTDDWTLRQPPSMMNGELFET